MYAKFDTPFIAMCQQRRFFQLLLQHLFVGPARLNKREVHRVYSLSARMVTPARIQERLMVTAAALFRPPAKVSESIID